MVAPPPSNPKRPAKAEDSPSPGHSAPTPTPVAPGSNAPNAYAPGCPVPHGGGNGANGGSTDYEKYMRTDELLRLQKPEPERVHHDELMFQVVHQSFELWCKLVRFELRSAAHLIAKDRLVEAYPLLERATAAIRINSEAMHVLETMTPWDFHVIRAALGQGSGAESPGFRGIQMDAPHLWPHVEALLHRRKTDLLSVYTDPASHSDLLRLLEKLTDFDMFFHIWRLNHLAMVKRVIGRDVKSLKGYAVHQLETDVNMTLWPALWKVRNLVTEKAGTSPP